MNFPYTEVEEYRGFITIRRVWPWMPITLSNPHNSTKVITPLGLIDSGADITMVDIEIGEYLGYKVEEGIKDIVFGVGGGKLIGYFHDVNFLIEDPKRKEKPIKYSDQVFFVKTSFPTTVPQQTAIFGTVGLFKHTVVTFDFPNVVTINQK